ncbi:hypothetical protein D3C85_1084650 [compost metagenome]
MTVTLTTGLEQAHALGKFAQLTGFEQHPQRQFHIAGLAHTGNDLRGQQRMAAQGEEVIAPADTRQAQYFAPDRGNFLLQGRLRRDVLTDLPHRFRQGATVQLAAGAQGHGSKAHQLRRDHVFRQLGSQSRLQYLDLILLG